MQASQIITLVAVAVTMFGVIGFLSLLAHYYTLNGIKARTVGDGQHGTARWASQTEIKKTYVHVPYTPKLWREKKNLPSAQGLVVGCKTTHGGVTALVDTGDVHCLMIGAAGVGKTANFLYPNLEYACASGMSFTTTDTKGDLYRNYGTIAKEYYGYTVSVLDLRNPTRSDGNNMLHLVNKYMDAYLSDPENLSCKAKAEKYAKIISKTVINPGGADAAAYGQNAFFYDAAEGLLTSVILLIAEYCPPPKRHIIGVFKLIQDLLAPSGVKGKINSSFSLKNCLRNIKPAGLREPPSTVRNRLCKASSPRHCPASMHFWILSWNKFSALTLPSTPRRYAIPSRPCFWSCRRKTPPNTF